MDPNNARKLELERKKQKLAEMREQKRLKELHQMAGPPGDAATQAPAAPDNRNVDVEQILMEAGINARASPIPREPSPAVQVPQPVVQSSFTSSSTKNLEMTQTQQIAIQTREITSYSKTTQTDDEARYSGCEFSLGSQEFAFDEYSEGDKHEINFDESPTREIASILPNFALNKLTGVEELMEEPHEDQKVPNLSEEEKKQIITTPQFSIFLEQSARVVERVLAEDNDVYINYAHDATTDDRNDNGEKLTKTREFSDEKWSEGRSVTAMDYSDLHPELIAVAYSNNKDRPLDPDGIVQVWNTKFKKQTPEYTFFAPSKITSMCFARFHPNLILGGCYSGQICMWDNRANKKTPVNKSPPSQACHTHPIYCLKVVGSQNAHNLISISTDGKLCSWSIENLNEPFVTIDIQSSSAKGRPIPVMSMSFAPNEVNSFVVGSEEGIVYQCTRHGQKNGVIGNFEGIHNAPVTAVDVYKASNPVGDYSHLFLSSSVDYSMKLWSLKDEKKPLLRSFDKHTDYVMAVAWHPTHPSVFASIDAAGNLFLWNINEDLESPITRVLMKPEVALRTLMWTENGQQLAIGDGKGKVHLYDVNDSISSVKQDDFTRFARTMQEVHRAAIEADDMLNEEYSMPRTSSGVGAAMGNGIASNASAPSANVSPRQQY